MNIILIICSLYTAVYTRVIAKRLRRLFRCVDGDESELPWGESFLSDFSFCIGALAYSVASGVLLTELLHFIWSFY